MLLNPFLCAMRDMRTLGLALAVLLMGAGCFAPNEPPNDTDGTAASQTSTNLDVGSPLPEWNRGQGWTYAVERPGEATETFKMMVAEDREDLWVVASDDRDQAINHAVYSTNPMLGRVGKETLAPFQSGAPVKMYQFPLTDGKTWTGSFFGTEMAFRAEYVGDIDASAINAARNFPKTLDGFRITATGGGQKVEYDYVEAIEWFTSFQLIEADGTKSVQLTLKDIESAYKGAYFFYRGAPDSVSLVKEKQVTNANPGTSETSDVTVPDGFKDFVGVGVVYVGKTGNLPPRVTFVLQKPGGSEALRQDLDGAREIHFLKDVAGTAGTWKLQATFQGSVQYEARVFGISKYAEGSI